MERRLSIINIKIRRLKLYKGDELGQFNMGSTVIMLLPETSKEINLIEGQELKMGQAII